MMISQEQFVENLKKSGLLSDQDLQRSLAEIDQATEYLDANSLADQLTAHGALNPYQAKALQEGDLNDLIIGNYEVLDRLGAGGMGTVYKARHRKMKRIVALKIISPSVAQSNITIRRFQREVEAIAQLSHPNIVMAHDADESDNRHFLVMEYVDGQDLAKVAAKEGPLPALEAVRCICQATEAMAYAHSKGIIHRDIKPANLLRDREGTVKVADLGLARFSKVFSGDEAATDQLTQFGGVMGTVAYMAPEQANDSSTADERTDIYSLGCTLYFLLTGRPPYTGKSMTETVLKHREAPVPSLRENCPGTPDALDAIYRKMVAKEPEFRFQSCREVLEALSPIRIGLENLNADNIAVAPSSHSWTSPKSESSSSQTTTPPADNVGVSSPPEQEMQDSVGRGIRTSLFMIGTIIALSLSAVLVWYLIAPQPKSLILGRWRHQSADGRLTYLEFDKDGNVQRTVFGQKNVRLPSQSKRQKYRFEGWSTLVFVDGSTERRFKYQLNQERLDLTSIGENPESRYQYERVE